MDLIGIEMFFSAGDACFSIPLIEALCKKNNAMAVVGTQSKYADIYQNIDCIFDIVYLSDFNGGEKAISSKYDVKSFYQITPCTYFDTFKGKNKDHSLTETIMTVGKMYGVDIDNRPRIYITEEEKSIAYAFFKSLNHNNVVALESEYLSGQSWATDEDFKNIVEKSPEKLFLWLSLKKPTFSASNLIYVGKSLTRRECIALLKYVELFINVGSGFFCASLSEKIQPKESWMLWIDDYYKYKQPITNAGWIPNARWFDDRIQWNNFIETIL